MKENTTIKLFDKHASKYDEMQPILVPHYDDIIEMVAEAFIHHIGKGNFLDLGCGTGNLSKNILKRSPESKVFLLDGSQAMIDIASGKVCKEFGDEVLLGSKAINLEEKEWSLGIPEKYDAIVTSFVLEHLQEANYRSVVKKCHDLLKPEGVLISVEWSDDEFGLQSWFVDMMKLLGQEHAKYQPFITEAKSSETHYFVNICDKMDWLKDAGYKNVHTIWQYLFGYVVVSHK